MHSDIDRLLHKTLRIATDLGASGDIGNTFLLPTVIDGSYTSPDSFCVNDFRAAQETLMKIPGLTSDGALTKLSSEYNNMSVMAILGTIAMK